MRWRSLTGRLTLVLIVATLVVTGVAGVLSYQRSFSEAQALQDDVLLQVAALASGTSGTPTTDAGGLSDKASDIDVTGLAASGLSTNVGRGPGTAVVGGQLRRFVVAQRHAGEPLVVSQSLTVRDEIARSAALSATLPLALLLLVLVVAIVIAVRTVLAPVDRLAHHVEQRDADDLTPLAHALVPTELDGFIAALDRMLGRVRDAQEHERRFIAEAAHELRTPLTATSLQLERAAAAHDPETVRARLVDAHLGIERSRHLVNQLLDLARAQAIDRSSPPPTEPFDHVLRTVIGQVLHLADERGAVLDVPRGGEDHTPVPATEVGVALRNVLDNAIRYGPHAGTITVSTRATASAFKVVVTDQGPGIRDPESAVRPFVREAGQAEAGTGLGLAIAAEQVRRIGGTLTLTTRTDGRAGLRAVLTIPSTHAGEDS